MRQNALLNRSLDFVVRIVKLHQFLTGKQKEFTLSGQLLRSGTSIGANIQEANYAQSKADFISKLHIALKETAETEYWLLVLQKSGYIGDRGDSLLADCRELKKLLISSLNTAKSSR